MNAHIGQINSNLIQMFKKNDFECSQQDIQEACQVKVDVINRIDKTRVTSSAFKSNLKCG